MRSVFYIFALLTLIVTVMAYPEGLQVEVKESKPNAKRRTQRGDKVEVHYVGTLEANGKEFDQSYKRGQPLAFEVGKGQVITGWDEGLLDMAVGEKRRLVIPPNLAYGDAGVGGGLIPPKATLVFETELVNIKGVPKDEL